MRVLWVFAQPEESSLNAALRDEGVAELRAQGHEVVVSDLYAMKWKPVVDRDDYPLAEEPVTITSASRRAYEAGTLAPDILAEQEKLNHADALVLHFPLWWYGMPAILKGWIDRVFVKGYAYGIADPAHPGKTLRYGEGTLTGKRALVITTAGSPAEALGPRGINGELEQVLFPLLHGTLWYTGMSVLPPVAVYGADRLDRTVYRAAARLVRDRVAAIAETPAIPYRTQNGGDYDDVLNLRPELAQGESGLAIHTDRRG